MKFLGIVSFLLFLLMLVVTINPKWISKGEKKYTRKQTLLSALVMFVLFCVFAINSPNTTTTPTPPTSVPTVATVAKTPEQLAKEKTDAELKTKQEAEAKAAAEKAAAEANAKKIPGTIGLKPNEFKDKWNSSATSLNMSDFKISKINVENGPAQDTFRYQFNDSHGLLGTVNKADGSIRDVMIIAAGQGLSNPKTASNVILSWGLLIHTTNQDLSASERGNILRDVGAMGDNANLAEADKSTVRGNVKYHLQSSKTLGIWFGASDVNDGK